MALLPALLSATLLATLALSGCSGLLDSLDSAPEGCGKERRHHVDIPANATNHAEIRMQDGRLVYLWEIPVTGACKKEHVDVDFRVVVDEGFIAPDGGGACEPVYRIIGSGYRPGQFLSAHTVNLEVTGTASIVKTYGASISYGLKQGIESADDPATYTVDLEVHYPLTDGEPMARECAAAMVKAVEITAVDRVDE